MMERLTFEGNFCDIAQCACMKCPYDTDCSQKQVWERLKAYEDSKLSPEDAANLHAILRLGDGMTLMRLRELAVADQEGRVIVLPCKVGANMIDSTFLEHPRIMKNVRPAVEYEMRGIIFNMSLQNFEAAVKGGVVTAVSEEAEKALAEAEALEITTRTFGRSYGERKDSDEH